MGNCCQKCKDIIRECLESPSAPCQHRQIYQALCVSPECPRQNSDRRLCDMCLVEHGCLEKVTIKELIDEDMYNLKSLFILLGNVGDQERRDKQQEEVGLVIDKFQYSFLMSLNSYQQFYNETLNTLLLQQLPPEIANQFEEAARQIIECKQRNDFSLCGKQGRFVLVKTFGKTEEVKQMIRALEDCPRRSSSKLEEIEQNLQSLITEWSTQVKTEAMNIYKALNTNEDLQSLDISKYKYNLTTLNQTTSISTTDRISVRCEQHNRQLTAICCNQKCPATDVRLCGDCLTKHPCSNIHWIKFTDYQTSQSLIIEAATIYINKKDEMVEVYKNGITNLFEKISQQVKNCCKDLKAISKESLDNYMYSGVDEKIRKLLPLQIENLKQVFQLNNIQTLHQEGVQIIAYLALNPIIKELLYNNNSEEAQNLVRRNFLKQLCQVLEIQSKKLIDALTNVDYAPPPQQNITTIDSSQFQNPINPQSNQPEIIQQQLPANASIVFKTDQKFEDQLSKVYCQHIQAMCRKTLKDFGDDSDDYISDILVYDGLLVATSHSGVVCAYQIDTEFNKICKIKIKGTCQSICAANYQNNKVVLAHRGQMDSHAIECHTLEEDSKLLFTMEGHNGPILHIKLIDQFVLTCSGDSSIRLWNLNTHKQIKEVRIHSKQVRDVVEIKQNIIASCSFDETIKIYNLQTDKVVHYMECKAYVFSLVMIQAQQCLVAATGDGSIYLYNSVNFGLAATFQLGEVSITSMALLGDSYLVLSQQNREAHIVKLSNGKIIDRIAKNDEYDGTPEAVYAYRNQIIYGDGNVIKVYS